MSPSGNREPKRGEVFAIPLDERRWAYAWILESMLVGYFDTCRDDPSPDLDELVVTPFAFRLWTSFRREHGWVPLGIRTPPPELLEPPLFFNADPISGRIHSTRGAHDDKVEITLEQALQLEEAAIWSPAHIQGRLREHFAGQPKKWLERSRLAKLGLVPGPALPPSPPPAPPTQSSSSPRVWLRYMVTDAYFPKLIVKRGQKLMAALDQRIAKERPSGKAVFKLTHATTRAFNRLALVLWATGSELETVAREAIADDIAFILEKYGYNVDLEEALGPRTW